MFLRQACCCVGEFSEAGFCWGPALLSAARREAATVWPPVLLAAKRVLRKLVGMLFLCPAVMVITNKGYFMWLFLPYNLFSVAKISKFEVLSVGGLQT